MWDMLPAIILVAFSIICFTVYAWLRWGDAHPGAGASTDRFVAAGGVLTVCVGVVALVIGLGLTLAALALTLGPHRGDDFAPGVILFCTTVVVVPVALILLGLRAARGGAGHHAALITAVGLCCSAVALNRGPQTRAALMTGAVILCAASLAVPLVFIAQRLRAPHR